MISRNCRHGAAVALFVALRAGPGAAANQCHIGLMATLPVTMEGLQPIVTVKINGADAKLLADSGAFYSILSQASAAQYGLALHPAPYGIRTVGIGGSSSLSLVTVKAFTMAGVTIPNVEFLVGGGETGAVGSIGENILGLGDTEYDLANGVIRLFRAHDCADKALAYWAGDKPWYAISMDPPGEGFKKIVTTVYINNVPVKAELDSGSEVTTLARRAARHAGIDLDAPGVTEGGLSYGVGHQAVRTRIVPVDSFRIGDETINRTKLRVSDSWIDSTDAPEMLIGADFFLSHRIFVANSQRKIYITYNGGKVFSIGNRGNGPAQTAPVPPVAAEPPAAAATNSPAVSATSVSGATENADDLARRGTASLARRDFAGAIADLSRAVTLAPTEPRYRAERARAYLANRQPFLAMADLDEALKLNPGDPETLLLRAEVRLSGHDKPGALTDLEAADKAAAKETDLRFTLAGLYEAAGALPKAVVQYDLWLAAHPVDAKRPRALNGRCWTRGLLGTELDLALADCNAALKLTETPAQVLDSRGLVYLRRGEFDKAITDYDAALAKRPKFAWSLYGRGIARLRKGLTADGEADIAAATALAPGLPGFAKENGIVP